MNCFTWNDIDSALMVCFKKNCNSLQISKQVFLKQGTINKHNFKIYGVLSKRVTSLKLNRSICKVV